METIAFYTFVTLVIAITLGLIYFIASRAHRVCKSHTWPKVVALGFAFVCLILTIASYLKDGPGSVWPLLTMPFSMVFYIPSAMGTAAYVFIASTVAASFWATLLYAATAFILRIRRGLG